MSSKTNDSIKRTGELLLSGWKLLNAGCPVCNTALMSKQALLRCPMCDMAVVSEADSHNIANVASKIPSLPVVAETKFDLEDDYYQYATGAPAKFESLNEAKKLYDAKNKRMDDVSNKLGAKMLAGFSMLSTVCPSEDCSGTPLVRLAGGPMICVCCESEYKVSALGDLIATPKAASTLEASNTKITPATVLAAATAASVTEVAPSTDAVPYASEAADNAYFLNMCNAPILDMNTFSRGVEDASSKISRKLMLGWALLEKCCQSKTCAGEVPLMRDLQGQECCVECGFPNSSTTAAAAEQKAPTYFKTSEKKRSLPDSQELDESESSESEDLDDSEGGDSGLDDLKTYQGFHHRHVRHSGSSASASASVSAPAPAPVPVPVPAPVHHRAPAAAVSSSNRREKKSEGGVAVQEQDQDRDQGQVVSQAQAVVRQKLAEATASLAASTGNVDACIRYADLIGKLGTALKALQGLDY